MFFFLQRSKQGTKIRLIFEIKKRKGFLLTAVA